MSVSPETQSPAGCNSHVVYKMSFGEIRVVLLRTISVLIINPNSERSILAYAQLDSESQATLISESLRAELGLEPHNNLNTFNRGEVEDARPEVKITKKIRDQGFPRTDPLEAKDRNARGQGPKKQTQVFSKKKGLQKNFSGHLKKKVFKNIF